MNNAHIDIRGPLKREVWDAAYDIAVKVEGSREEIPVIYTIHKSVGLVAFWHKEVGSLSVREGQVTVGIEDPIFLPFAFDPKDFIWGWLRNQGTNDFELGSWEKGLTDFDGSLGEGFRIFTQDWGHLLSNPYAIFAAKPIYAWYGK